DAAVALDPPGDAVTQWPDPPFTRGRKGLGRSACTRPAISSQGAGAASRSFWPANGRAEIHHRLGEVASATVRDYRLDQRLDLSAPGLLERSKPGDHPFDVGVDRGGVLSERDRGNRGGSICADAGELAKSVRSRREAAEAHDFAGAGDHVPRPDVVAEPGPFLQDVLVRRSRQRIDRRPARNEALE